MNPTIIAHAANGIPIQGPDCVKHPACLSMLRHFLDFAEPGADGGFDSLPVQLTGRQISDALKQVISELRANRRRCSQLLDEEYELIRPPMPAHVLAAQEAMGPPLRFSIPWNSGGARNQEDGVPSGMIEFHEIRMTRTIGNPDPEVLQPILDEIERSRGESHALWELLGFLWRCRASAPVTITSR